MTSHHTIHALMVGMSGRTGGARGSCPACAAIWSAINRLPIFSGSSTARTVPSSSIPVTIPTTLRRSGRRGKNFIEPPALLREIGVKAEEVKTVIVTHFHQDHFTGLDYFPTAKFVIQRAELEFWTGPLMRHEIFDRQIRPRVRPALEKLKQDGRIELVDGDFRFTRV